MPALLERLGCQVTVINLEPDGRFPRPPEPVPENLGELEALVERVGADVGFAVDPDVDRLAIVDERGRAIGEDYTLALAARVVLKRTPGIVVTNLSTSRIVDDVAAESGGRVIRAPVGEVNVAVRMRDEQAVIAHARLDNRYSTVMKRRLATAQEEAKKAHRGIWSEEKRP